MYFVGDTLGREVVLHQFRHDAPARHQVHHPERVQLHERPAESVGEGRYPVDDDHRPLVQRCLHSRRSRGRHHDVACAQHIIGPSFDDGDSAVEDSGVNSDVARCGARATMNCTAGTCERISSAAAARVGSVARTSLGRLPGKQRHRGGLGSSSAPLTGARRGRRHANQIDQRVADELDRHTRALVDRSARTGRSPGPSWRSFSSCGSARIAMPRAAD